MRRISALTQAITLVFMAVLTGNGLQPKDTTANAPGRENKIKYLFRKKIVAPAGTFTKPGRNLSIGLRWQK
jgi:hypothetical protein